MSKAIFMDLDGTLIETKSGKDFPVDVGDWKFKEYVLDSLIELYEQEFHRLYIITNQGGIPKYTNPGVFNTKLHHIIDEIYTYFNLYYKNRHSFMVDYYVAIGMKHPGRKPNKLFFDMASQASGYLDKETSIMIGDAGGRKGDHSDSDKMFAKNAGIEFIHIDNLLAKVKEKYENKTD